MIELSMLFKKQSQEPLKVAFFLLRFIPPRHAFPGVALPFSVVALPQILSKTRSDPRQGCSSCISYLLLHSITLIDKIQLLNTL